VERVYDDDVIFEWHLDEVKFSQIATGTQPGNLPNGSPGVSTDPCIPTSAANRYSTHPDFPGIYLRPYGTPLFYNTYTGEKGFRLGGYTNAGGPRFVIGQGIHVETANTNTAATNIGGQIDLSQRKVKVTVGYADIVDTANRYNLRIAVNNNTATAANSSLGTSSTIKTFIWGAASTDANHVKIETDGVAGTEFVKAGSNKTAGELYAVIDPSAFIGNDGLGSLQNAFIMLHGQNLSAAGTDMAAGNWITITYIKIEYTGGNVEMPDPVALTVMDGSTPVGSNIAMTLGDPAKTLTATVDPVDAAIAWEITSGTSVTLSTATGGSTNITPVAAGNTTITVTATKAGYITTIKTFTVTVSGAVVLFEWNSGTDQAWTELNTGAGNSKTLGSGSTSATIRTYGARTYAASDGKSIQLGGKLGNGNGAGGTWTASAGPRLAIGQATMQATANTDASTINYAGEFNLTNKKIQVTISYKDVVQNSYSARDILWITINNNGTSGTASYLGAASQVKRYVAASELIDDSEASSSTTSGTLKTVIDCNAIAGLKDKETLDKAFIGLYTLHDNVASAAGDGVWITITGIKIEIID